MYKLSYALGMVIGENLRGLNVSELNTEEFGRAVADVLAGGKTELTPAEAQMEVQHYLQQQQNEASRTHREAGEKYLADNAQKDGVTTLPSGLQYLVLRKSEIIGAPKPAATDQVQCHYEGRLIDGTVFDSSYRRGEPATFPLDGVIRGWTEGLQLMAEGDKFRFFIPHHLAYGERGAGQSIPPCATLVFDVELLKVIK